MANVEKTVAIVFKGEDQLSKKIHKMQGKMNSFAGSVESMAKPLATLGHTIMGIDAALGALAALGFTYALKKSLEFETATVNLEKILGSQADQIGGVAEKALLLSDKYGQSSTAILGSMTDFKRAGFDLLEITKLVEDSMSLVLAASEEGFESAQATEIIIATLKGFKAPAEDAARLVDILNKVSNEYATNVTELGVGMATLSPIAAKMGFSFEETAGVLTPIIEIFRSGDEASTALKMGLLKLIDDAKPVRDALASIGVSQTTANGSLRSGKDILFDVAKAFKTLDEDQKLYVTSQLVGIRQAAKMVEIFDGLGYSAKITAVALGAGGSAALEVAKKLETGEVAIARMITGFNNLSIAVGTRFKDAAKEAINSGANIENVLRAMVSEGTFDPIFDEINAFSKKLSEYLDGIAKAMPEAFENVNFDDLLDAFRNIGEGLAGIFDGLDLTKPEDITKAVQFVVDSLESLVRVTDGMVDIFRPLIENIINTIDGFNKLDNATKESGGGIVGLGTAITDFGLLFLGLLVTLGQNAAVIKTVLGDVINSIVFMWDSTAIIVESILLFLAERAQDLLKVMAKVTFGDWRRSIEEADESVQSFQNRLKEDISARAEANLDKLTKTFGITTEAIKETTKALEEIPPTADVKMYVDLDDKFLLDLKKTLREAGVLVEEKKPELTIDVEADEASLQKTEAVLNEVAKSRKVEVDLQTEKIKAQADTVQSAIEWKAKINIAQVKAATESLKSTFRSLDASIKSTGTTLSSLWKTLAAGDLRTEQRWALEETLENEEDRRQQSFDLQKELTEQQIALNEAKMAALERGESLITIDGAGLQPHLEAFMFEVLEAIQVRANAEGAEFLLGV